MSSHPDDLRWSRFCRFIVERIERIRETESPACRDCLPCSAHGRGMAEQSSVTRRCSRCRVVKLLDGGFPRDRGKPLGYGYLCLVCKKRENKISNRRRKARRAEVAA